MKYSVQCGIPNVINFITVDFYLQEMSVQTSEICHMMRSHLELCFPTLIIPVHFFVVGLLGCNAIWTCRKVPVFQRNIPLLYSGLKCFSPLWKPYISPFHIGGVLLIFMLYFQHSIYSNTDCSITASIVSFGLCWHRWSWGFLADQIGILTGSQWRIQSNYWKTCLLQLRDSSECCDCTVYKRSQGTINL
jgi:hypothetical protein